MRFGDELLPTIPNILDETIQVALTAVLIYVLYGTLSNRLALIVLLIPLLIDSDHLLPLYSEGIKAFHSMMFISLLSLAFVIYGLKKHNRSIMFMGGVAYSAGVLNISIDLLEGGRINFLYPFMSDSYVLVPGESSYLSILTLLIYSLMAAYAFRIYLDLERKDLTGEPQTGHS